jgi:hypothetical protein
MKVSSSFRYLRQGSRLRFGNCAGVVVATSLLSIATIAQAEEPKPAAEAPAAEEARSTGLPGNGEWTFNLDAGLGAFGFNNSLYATAHEDPSGNLSDNWAESYIKPALSVNFPMNGGSVLYGKASVVGERTFSAPPTIVGDAAQSFQIEDAYVGWKSGKSIGSTEDAIDFTVGRAPYKIGHGFLLSDGGGEGGSRGGYWTNARKAWELAGIGRFKFGKNTLEAFYLDRDDLPENDVDNKVWGANYELALNDANVIGVTYLKTSADPAMKPLRDGMDVWDARAFIAPFSAVPGLAFEFEYAAEDNGDLMSSTAWSGQASYEFGDMTWKPRISYRYAFFEGDDPNTAKDENWDSLFPGFYDWGQWWQGEIGGEYFLSNSNLISSELRLHVTPSESVSGGLIYFDFTLDHPESFAPGVTSDKVAQELDAYLDWKLNGNFTASFVLAYATPDDAIQQGFGRTKDMSYGMVYLAYAY